jgi:hypothetical protein
VRADRAVGGLLDRPGGSLLIRATLNGTSHSATRDVTGGPGPSLINLPAAGCWTFNLSWSGITIS